MTDQIINALEQLDPKNDHQWTEEGAPLMAVIHNILGNDKVTRQEVTDAIPNFTRQNLIEAAKEKEVADGQVEEKTEEVTATEEVATSPEAVEDPEIKEPNTSTEEVTEPEQAPIVVSEPPVAAVEPEVTAKVEETQNETGTNETHSQKNSPEEEENKEENSVEQKQKELSQAIKEKRETIERLKREIDGHHAEINTLVGEDRSNLTARQQTIENQKHLKALQQRKIDAHNKRVADEGAVGRSLPVPKSKIDARIAAQNKYKRRNQD